MRPGLTIKTGHRSKSVKVSQRPLAVTAVLLLRSPFVGSSRKSRLTRIFSSSSDHHLLVPSCRLKARAGSVMDGGMTKMAIIPTMIHIRPSIRKLGDVSVWKIVFLCASNLQPLPSSPSLDAAHFQKTSGEKTSVGLSQWNDSVEEAETDRQLVALVKVRQVQHLYPTFSDRSLERAIKHTISGIKPPWANPKRPRRSQKLHRLLIPAWAMQRPPQRIMTEGVYRKGPTFLLIKPPGSSAARKVTR